MAPIIRYCQSLSSNWKMSSVLFLNTLAIFNASSVDGTNFPDSIALIVCLLTPTASANCCCEMRTMARSTLILFFIFARVFIEVVAEYENVRE